MDGSRDQIQPFSKFPNANRTARALIVRELIVRLNMPRGGVGLPPKLGQFLPGSRVQTPTSPINKREAAA